jgi:WD40 repeat protein
VSADHELLFTNGPNGAVQRSLSTFAPTGRRPIGGAGTTRIAVAGDLLAVSTEDGHLEILDIVTLEPVGPALPSTQAIVNDLRLSGDGSRLLAVNHDRTARLFDLQSGTMLGTPIDLGQEEGAIRRGALRNATGELDHDGRTMVLATAQGVVIWKLEPDHLTTAACRVAGRNLTKTEWREHLAFLGPYRPVCP